MRNDRRPFSFIGSGKMAEAMINGLLKKGIPPNEIFGSGPRKERGQELEGKYGIGTGTSNLEAIPARVITLSVKPQTMRSVLAEMKGKMDDETIVVSIAAGVKLQTIADGLDTERVVRAMPNTPGRINRGVTIWTATKTVESWERKAVQELLGVLGTEIFVDEEKYLDMATALSGSGPAYIFLFMEALIDAGVRLGLPRYLAEQLIQETVAGSAEYAKASGAHLAELRNEVTSSAGTSAEALYQLEKAGFRTGIAKAVQAAYLRSVELGKAK